jgi:hypothetical protein
MSRRGDARVVVTMTHRALIKTEGFMQKAITGIVGKPGQSAMIMYCSAKDRTVRLKVMSPY